jgi:hypothetical protein
MASATSKAWTSVQEAPAPRWHRGQDRQGTSMRRMVLRHRPPRRTAHGRPHGVMAAAFGCGASAPGSSRQRDTTRRFLRLLRGDRLRPGAVSGTRGKPDGTGTDCTERPVRLPHGAARPVPPAQVAGDERESGRHVQNAAAADSGFARFTWTVRVRRRGRDAVNVRRATAAERWHGSLRGRML